MKLTLSVIGFILVYLPFGSEGETIGEPFHPANVEIQWNASTTNLPTHLWVYKVFPQTFSPAVISNLMAIGSFTSKNLSKPSVDIADKNLIHFRVKKGSFTRYLNVAPTLGWIEYYDSEAKAEFGREEAVPDDKRAIQLARDLLFQIGIDKSLVAEKPNALSAGRQGKVGTPTSEGTEAVFSRGVFFTRRLDGVSICGSGGQGGLLADFGNHGKILSFNLVWRNLVPHRAFPVASQKEIINWIKQGKGIFPAPHEDFSRAKKLTVTRITPYYEGADGSEPLSIVRPFAELEMEAEANGKVVKFGLHCPIIPDSGGQ